MSRPVGHGESEGHSIVRKDSALPYYVQIRNALVEQIRRGEHAAGTLLPGEGALADRFGVNRMTIRQALGALREGGYISTERGRGSRVTGPKIEQSLLRFYSFGRSFRETAKQFTSQVIDASVIGPSREFADRFTPAQDERFYQIVRLRILEGIPLILERAIIPVAVAPGIIERNLEAESIYDLLERDYGQSISGATEYIEPRIVQSEDAGLLQIECGAPVFYTERLTRNTAGRVVEVRTSLIRGDKMRFRADLSLGPEFPRPYRPGESVDS